MKKFGIVISFLPLWIFYYLVRIIWYDIIHGLISFILDIIMLHPIIAFMDLLSIALTPIDAIIGLFLTFISAIDTCKRLMQNDLSKEDELSIILTNSKKKKVGETI